MRFLADENFNGKLLKALRKALPDLDIVRAQETEIYRAPDPQVLEWAAQENRIVLTHDIQTMTKFAYERVEAELSMPGVIEVSNDISIGQVIDELATMIGASTPEEFELQVKYIPIR